MHLHCMNIFLHMRFALGFAVLCYVMQFVISSHSNRQTSFPCLRQLAFHKPDIKHAVFGELI